MSDYRWRNIRIAFVDNEGRAEARRIASVALDAIDADVPNRGPSFILVEHDGNDDGPFPVDVGIPTYPSADRIAKLAVNPAVKAEHDAREKREQLAVVAAKFLLASWRPVFFDYHSLTSEEMSHGTREEFEALVVESWDTVMFADPDWLLHLEPVHHERVKEMRR